jgi:hypothetical protein
MRVYYLPNCDGVRGCMVAARNQADAVKLMGVSAGGFRAFGGRRADDPEMIEIATREPGVVWWRRITVGPDRPPWVRYRADA